MAPLKATDRALNVLLVEDNPGDVRLVKEAFHEAGVAVEITVAADGAQALALLDDAQARVSTSRPTLVLLDLNLPRVPGGEVLAHIKGDPDLRSIPVVIFSSSGAPSDVRDMYERHANCYVQKPVGLDAYIEVVGQLQRFWLETVRLPRAAA